MTGFDLLLRGGTVIDGTGAPGRRADVGVLGDRILAVGDLGAVAGDEVGLALDVTDRVIAPGFIDPHGHSDGSLFLDGALVSHLRQGFTTQLSGNCGDTLAPITPVGRDLVEVSLRTNELTARWRTFAEFLDEVEREPLGPNVAFLVGHGTVRGSVLGADARGPTDLELRAMVNEVEAAIEAGALGLSSGLIYAPGVHAGSSEMAALVRATTRHGGLYASHIRNEADGLFEALDEALTAVRAAGDGGRLQVSHLKCGSRAVWGRAAEAIGLLERARDEGVDVAADQYPYTAAATTLTIVLPPALLGLGVEQCVAALGDREVRFRVRAEIDHGSSGWENVAADPGWAGIRISYAASHPEWAGRSLAELGADLDADPADLAFDALMDDRLDVSIVIDCMSEADVETILAVALDRGLHRRRGSPAGPSDPRRRAAASTDVRDHGACPRHVRPRPRDALARDGDREAHVGASRAPRPARSRDPARGVVRGSGRGRSGDRGRRGDLPRARAPPARHRARHRQRPAGRARRPGDRTTVRTPPATGHVTRSTPGATEQPAIAHLQGGPIRYTLRRSPRARTLRVVIHPERGVVVTVPAAGRRGWSDPERHVAAFLGEREPWLRRHLDRNALAREELAARGGLEDGALVRYRGDLHRLRIEPGPPGARRSVVEREGDEVADRLVVKQVTRDRRSMADVLEAWFRPRAKAEIERAIARHADGLGVRPTGVALRDPRTRWGSASHGGRLSFSWRLILAPPEALETVVIHELAHLRIFGHGPAFWALVAERRPDHVKWRHWLRDHALELHGALGQSSSVDGSSS